MSNRYFNLANLNSSVLANVLPHPNQKRHNNGEERVKDETVAPRRIHGNNFLRMQIHSAQQAKNYHMEKDRLTSMLRERRIPANREMGVRGRIRHIDEEMQELEPYLGEVGRQNRSTN